MSIKNQIMSTAILATVDDTLRAGDFSYSAYGKTHDGNPIEAIVAAVNISQTQKDAANDFNFRKRCDLGLGR